MHHTIRIILAAALGGALSTLATVIAGLIGSDIMLHYLIGGGRDILYLPGVLGAVDAVAFVSIDWRSPP